MLCGLYIHRRLGLLALVILPSKIPSSTYPGPQPRINLYRTVQKAYSVCAKGGYVQGRCHVLNGPRAQPQGFLVFNASWVCGLQSLFVNVLKALNIQWTD
jgi:hypothetical protein